MTQKRYINFGTTVEAAKVKSILSNIISPQVLSGGQFLVSGTSELLIEPLALLFPDGVLMEETEEKHIALADGTTPIVQGTARNYTVYYTHIDENIIGGSSATLSLTANIIGGGGFLQSVANGVIVGWIKYPGGSVPLDATMFYYPPRTKLQSPVSKGFGQFIKAPFPATGAGVYWQSNSNTISNNFDANGVYTQFTGAGSSILHFAFKGDTFVPTALRVDAQLIGSGSQFVVRVFDDSNTQITFDDSATSRTIGVGPLAFQTFEIRFKTGSFIAGKNYRARLDVAPLTGGGDQVKLYSVGVTPYNLPF